MVDERWETQVACPGCGCVCDDLALRFDGGKLAAVQPGCSLAEQWYFSHAKDDRPVAELNGTPCGLEEAIDRGAEILRLADNPLIYGLSRSATPGQRQAVALAEKLGGVVDTTASMCHGPSIMAIQEFGECTCTLGEIRNRADLVIFWGCNPGASHPRHAERYSVDPHGRYRSEGRGERTIVMVGPAGQVEDWRLDPAGARPDLVIATEPGRDFELIAELRALVRSGVRVQASADAQRLISLMRGCQTGVVFFGLGLVETEMWAPLVRPMAGQVNVAALLQLVSELNEHARFFARRMRLQGDVSGADNVMTWQTGYPFAVNYSRGYPRYNPGEFSASELLDRGDVDACLFVGTETAAYFSRRAHEHLASIPTVVLDYPGAELSFSPTVQITTAVYGLHAAGGVYRMDNVPLHLRGLIDGPYPTDEAVLRALAARV